MQKLIPIKFENLDEPDNFLRQYGTSKLTHSFVLVFPNTYWVPPMSTATVPGAGVTAMDRQTKITAITVELTF